jgi:hypothetical protein
MRGYEPMASLRLLAREAISQIPELRTRRLNPQLQAAAIREFNRLGYPGFRRADRGVAQHLLAPCIGTLRQGQQICWLSTDTRGRSRTLVKLFTLFY